MSTAVTFRLAQVALRAVLAEVESAPELAGEALSRLLGLGAPAAEPDYADLGRQVLAAGGNEDEEDQDEEPAPRARKRPGPRPGRPPGVGEAAPLVDRLAEAHGSLNAAARAIGTSPPLMRGWRKGKPIKPASLERLRAAVAELDEHPRDEPEDGDGPILLEPEASDMVDELERRHGSLEVVAERFGLALPRLRELADGARASPSTVARLRSALASPTPVEAQRRAAGDDQDDEEQDAGDEQGAEVAPPAETFRPAG